LHYAGTVQGSLAQHRIRGVSLAARAILLGPLLAASAARAETTLHGRVTHVHDGDAIKVEGVAVRLEGLHAPELHQEGGKAAAAFLRTLVEGKTVVCSLTGERSHERRVGCCFRAGADIAASLARAGLGRDCPRFSEGRYAGEETGKGRELPLPAYCRER
jgi:endonuclease YncB( thermonuclease family)